MAGWNKLPVTTTDFPAAQHMDEIRAAMDERNDLLDDSAVGEFIGADYRITLPTDVAVGDYGKHMLEYQNKLTRNVPAGPNSLLHSTVAGNTWTAGLDDDLKTLVTFTPAGGGEINIHTMLGAPTEDFPYLGGLPTTGHRGDINHPNWCRDVLNVMVRMKSGNLNTDNPMEEYDDAVTTWCGNTATDAVWATALSDCFASADTYHGSTLAIVATTGDEVLLGRIAGDTSPAGDFECDCYAELKMRNTTTLGFPVGTTAVRAWIAVRTYDVTDTHGAGYDVVEEFDFALYLDGNKQGSTITTGSAADALDFTTFEGTVFDAWLIELDVDDLDLQGANIFEFRYMEDVSTEPVIGEGETYCQAFIQDEDEPFYCLIVEFDNLSYVTTAFMQEDMIQDGWVQEI